MFSKKTVKDVDINGKNVLVRVDYNVPMQHGVIKSDLRIRGSIPTIKYLYEHGAKKIILISHMGRPDGTRVGELSLRPVAGALQKVIESEFGEKHPTVNFIPNVSGPDVEIAAGNLADGDILMLENLRFYPGEEANSSEFAQKIVNSVHADLFVQDGFAVVHRAHASTDAITHEIPAVAGLLVENEVSTLQQVVHDPVHPVLVMMGGVKVDDKQPIIDVFADSADNIAVIGKIAADGYVPAPEIADKVYVAEDFHEDNLGQKLDIGEKSIAKISKLIASANTVIWNGVAGVVEDPNFSYGSEQLAISLGQKLEGDPTEVANITTVICGGDTSGFVENYISAHHPELSYSLVSTGGGASLELLSGLPLPGIEALENK